jgi:hypothetical protein
MSFPMSTALRSRPLENRSSSGTPPSVPGWRLNYVAGFVPLLAGVMTIATSWINVVRSDAPWWTGAGILGFSYASLKTAGTGAAPYVELTGSVGGVNIVGAAIAVILIARYGLGEGRRWAWWFLSFCLLWIGVHDAVMATRFFHETGQPFMLMPFTYCALMLAGLLKSRRAVFEGSTVP